MRPFNIIWTNFLSLELELQCGRKPRHDWLCLGKDGRFGICIFLSFQHGVLGVCEVKKTLWYSTCGSYFVVSGYRFPLTSSARCSRPEPVELWGLYPDSPPPQQRAACGLPAGSGPLCRKPRSCWPLLVVLEPHSRRLKERTRNNIANPIKRYKPANSYYNIIYNM